MRGEVRFEHVGFRYDEDGPPTLRGVDLTVEPGTKVAIVGETGSGKTTLGYLVARLYDVSDGRVTIDGVDVRDLSFASLARTVGLVSQETYLFHASIADNLRFAKPEATREELVAAARAAQIHDLVAGLPDGYDTIVGERGYRFSGGEKQRIAIARTILRNPPVLVLDEATSALDSETERAVQEALDSLAEGRTTIAIAHRLSTVRDADEIVVLDRGRSPSAARTRSCSPRAGATPRSSPAATSRRRSPRRRRDPPHRRASVGDHGRRDPPAGPGDEELVHAAGGTVRRRSEGRMPRGASCASRPITS